MDPLTLRSPQIRALLVITFLFPVVLCGVFFPTPAGDLREHINLGLSFRLYKFMQPPLQTWLAGLVALTGARDAWLFIVVAQTLNFIGLAYLALTAKRFLGDHTVVPLVIMFCGSLFYSQATPSMALNADQIQVPLWAGILFHGMMALRDDRWRDWIACGLLIGLTVLAKYTVILLVGAIVIALALTPAYRRVFVNPKLYVAGLASLPLAAVHIVPELSRGYSVDYASSQFRIGPSITARLYEIWQFVRSYLIYGAPILIGLAELARRRALHAAEPPLSLAARFIVLLVVICIAIILILVGLFGLKYETRHTYPLFGLSLLALLATLRIDPKAMPRFAAITLVIWACVIVGALIYTQVAINRSLRDPAPAAAAALRAAWDEAFTCGPAYILGDDRGARGIAINFGRRVGGVPFGDTGRTDWLDPARLAASGAIVVTTASDVDAPEAAPWFKGRTQQRLAFPYRRTFRSDQHVYVYSVIAPERCATAK